MLKSLPRFLVKSRNSVVMIAHTVCVPVSMGPVVQQPSRKKPVNGLVLQVMSCSPNTFSCEVELFMHTIKQLSGQKFGEDQ